MRSFVPQVRNCTAGSGSATLASQYHIVRVYAVWATHMVDLLPRLLLQASSPSPYATGHVFTNMPTSSVLLPIRFPLLVRAPRARCAAMQAIIRGRLPLVLSSCIVALRASGSAFPSSGKSHCHGLATYSSPLSCVPASSSLSCAPPPVSSSWSDARLV